MEVILFRQILSVTTTSKMNTKAIINRTITPKIASDCRTLFDLLITCLYHDVAPQFTLRWPRFSSHTSSDCGFEGWTPIVLNQVVTCKCEYHVACESNYAPRSSPCNAATSKMRMNVHGGWGAVIGEAVAESIFLFHSVPFAMFWNDEKLSKWFISYS